MNRKTLAALSVVIIMVSMAVALATALFITDEPSSDETAFGSGIKNMEASAPEPGGPCSLTVNVRPADGERVIIEESHGDMGVVDTSAFTQPTSFGKSLMRGSDVTVYAANLTAESVSLINESTVTEDCTLSAKTDGE